MAMLPPLIIRLDFVELPMLEPYWVLSGLQWGEGGGFTYGGSIRFLVI